jgi:hypothetical protein
LVKFLSIIDRETKDFSFVYIISLLIKEKDISKILKWSAKIFEFSEIYENTILVLLLLDILILKKQYHFLLNHFQKENGLLMKSAKPYYYALAYFLKDELPGEYEKAGGEIKETVDEIIQKHKGEEKKQ